MASMIRKPYRYVGLSTDTKPTGLAAGATFLEYDTGNLYIYSGADWSIKSPASVPFQTTTINLNQVAGNYDLFTIGASDVRILELCIIIPADLTGDAAGSLESISIQSTDDTPVEFISAEQGAKANLSADAHLQYFGAETVAATKKIQLTIDGGATAADQNCHVFVKYAEVS